MLSFNSTTIMILYLLYNCGSLPIHEIERNYPAYNVHYIQDPIKQNIKECNLFIFLIFYHIFFKKKDIQI